MFPNKVSMLNKAETKSIFLQQVDAVCCTGPHAI